MRTAAMVSLFYILTLLSLVAYGCPPPFNSFKYANNDTLLREKIDEYKSDPQLGWAHVVGGVSALRPWPANSQGIVIIPFCFVDAWVKQKVEQKFHDAWQRWSNKIGDPKPQTGHRLGGFQEIKDKNGNSIFCYRDKAHKLWNSRAPAGTLQIQVLDNTSRSQATMGYLPPEWANENGRHVIQIGWTNNPMTNYDLDVFTLAHEMGHVFGLQHEHQRPDRDSYVKFQCSNLDHYADALTKPQNHPQITIQDLCTSAIESRLEPWTDLPFGAWDFSTETIYDIYHVDQNNNPDGWNHRYELTHGRDYDLDSIMHYYSKYYARPDVASGSTPLTVGNAPLVVWKDGGPGYQPPNQATPQNAYLKEIEEKQYRRWPSDGDFQGIKAIYPW